MRRPLLVPAPSVCQVCDGEGFLVSVGEDGPLLEPCLHCPRNCLVCGEPTDTPPECDRCACEEEAAAKRRSDV